MNFLKDMWWVAKTIWRNPAWYLFLVVFVSPLISGYLSSKPFPLQEKVFCWFSATGGPLFLLVYITLNWRDYQFRGPSKYDQMVAQAVKQAAKKAIEDEKIY